MKNLSLNLSIAAMLSAAFRGDSNVLHRGRTVSPVQERMRAKWEADAPRRRQVAAEIAAWNAGVKRRNRRFVARQIARGRVAL